LAGVEGQVADQPRFVTEVNPKTGDLSVRDTQTGELLDIVDCARRLNESFGTD
jgi:hypothetical protein